MKLKNTKSVDNSISFIFNSREIPKYIKYTVEPF